MKRIFQLMTVALVTVMLSGTAWAVTGGHDLGLITPANPTGQVLNADPLGVGPFVANDMISVAPDGRGDLLIFPMVYGAADFTTKLTIVNTDVNASQVAKVVLRDFDRSEEVLNFYIYLSPADAWTGYLYLDAGTNELRLYSDDDSIKTVFNDWATPDDPFVGRLTLGGAPVNGPMWFGYATVFNVATTAAAPNMIGRPGIPNLAAALALNARPVDKNLIEGFFWNSLAVADLTNEAPLPGAVGSNMVRTGPSVVGFAPFPVRDIAAQRNFDRNVLAGWQSFTFGNSTPPFDGMAQASGALQATTLRDYFVSTRPALGRDMMILNSSNWTNLNEVEVALAKSRVIMPFANTDSQQSIHVFNFPTKYTGQGPNVNPLDPTSPQLPGSGVFQINGFGPLNEQIYYALRAFDLQEQARAITTSPSSYDWAFETAMIDTGWLDGPDQFDGRLWNEGWIEYTPLDPNDLPVFSVLLTSNFTFWNEPARWGDVINVWGVPMLSMNIHLDGLGLSVSQAAYGPTYRLADPAPINAGDFNFSEKGVLQAGGLYDTLAKAKEAAKALRQTASR